MGQELALLAFKELVLYKYILKERSLYWDCKVYFKAETTVLLLTGLWMMIVHLAQVDLSLSRKTSWPGPVYLCTQALWRRDLHLNAKGVTCMGGGTDLFSHSCFLTAVFTGTWFLLCSCAVSEHSLTKSSWNLGPGCLGRIMKILKRRQVISCAR